MRLPALGRGFTCHPQFFVYGLFDEPVDAHKGAFRAVRSEDASFRRQGIKLESHSIPPIATAMLLPGFGPRNLGLMKGYRHLASMEVAVRDEPTGRLRLGAGASWSFNKTLTAPDRRKARAGVAIIRDRLSTAGARRVVACRQGFALHPMGGFALGDDPARSVVGPDFRVHSCPHVYAADSSVFPSAAGHQPVALHHGDEPHGGPDDPRKGLNHGHPRRNRLAAPGPAQLRASSNRRRPGPG